MNNEVFDDDTQMQKFMSNFGKISNHEICLEPILWSLPLGHLDKKIARHPP